MLRARIFWQARADSHRNTKEHWKRRLISVLQILIMSIKCIVVDDHTLFRDGLRRVRWVGLDPRAQAGWCTDGHWHAWVIKLRGGAPRGQEFPRHPPRFSHD